MQVNKPKQQPKQMGGKWEAKWEQGSAYGWNGRERAEQVKWEEPFGIGKVKMEIVQDLKTQTKAI